MSILQKLSGPSCKAGVGCLGNELIHTKKKKKEGKKKETNGSCRSRAPMHVPAEGGRLIVVSEATAVRALM